MTNFDEPQEWVYRVRRALGDLWRREPARVVGYVVTLLAAVGVVVTTEDITAVLTVIVPLVAGTEGIRSQVSSPATVHKIDPAASVKD